jgi:phosphatidylinositol alpha-1,6-mannosyltransferase
MQTEVKRHKILLITRNLPPLVGGMERMMQQLAQGVSEYADLTVIGPRGCKEHLPQSSTVYEASSHLGPFLLFSTLLGMRACRTTKYDVVIGGSGLIGPTLRILALLFRCRTLIYLHGLDLVVDSAAYQKLFVPSLRHVDSVAVNSGSTFEIAIRKGIDKTRMTIVHPGTALPGALDYASRQDFRNRYSIPFNRYMLFTGRMTKRKGLSGFLQHALPAILKAEQGVGLVVVGEEPLNSLNQQGEEAQIHEQLHSPALRESVVFLGKLTDLDLQLCYAEAALQIFPLVQIHGDIEGFGMVAIEAAACGTPTVAFELGGVSDAISSESGYLVAPGDFRSFADSIIRILQDGEPSAEQCVRHAKRFSWDSYNEKMQSVITGSIGT